MASALCLYQPKNDLLRIKSSRKRPVIEEPQKWETKIFAEFICSMQESYYSLTPPDPSGIKLRYLTTHYQFSLLFLDKEMNKIAPTGNRVISFNSGSYTTHNS